MKHSSTTKCSGKALGFHKYLKPGELAKLRDSKISKARSYKKPEDDNALVTRLLESALWTREGSGVMDQVPCFTRSYGGTRCLRRKKLVAVNSVVVIGNRDNGDVLVQ